MSFARHLADLIRHDGPLRLDRFMGLANAHYYATRDPLGAAGDFTTSPEISQLFGEMIGLCLVDFWERSGSPAEIALVELGPGRGTLMADLLRAARIRPAFLKAARIVLVETSPTLRQRQSETLNGHDVAFCGSFDDIPSGMPLYLVANEFFDALPIRQFETRDGTIFERHVTLDDTGAFAFTLLPTTLPSVIPAEAKRRAGTQGPRNSVSAAHGSRVSGASGGHARNDNQRLIYEINEPARAIAASIGTRLRETSGIALVIDYGAFGTAGDTLQAVRAHRFDGIFDAPGEADLTAHVDFRSFAEAAEIRPFGPVPQGDFLNALGIQARAAALSRARPDKTGDIQAAVERLTGGDSMGILFKAIALTGPGAPIPAGFAP